jgi:hypothetical protein
VTALNAFHATILRAHADMVGGMRVEAVLQSLVESTGYLKDVPASGGKEDGQERRQGIDQLMQLAARIADQDPDLVSQGGGGHFGTLANYQRLLEVCSLNPQESGLKQGRKGKRDIAPESLQSALTFSTIHGAKVSSLPLVPYHS